jgi:hypothetical protein
MIGDNDISGNRVRFDYGMLRRVLLISYKHEKGVLQQQLGNHDWQSMTTSVFRTRAENMATRTKHFAELCELISVIESMQDNESRCADIQWANLPVEEEESKEGHRA